MTTYNSYNQLSTTQLRSEIVRLASGIAKVTTEAADGFFAQSDADLANNISGDVARLSMAIESLKERS